MSAASTLGTLINWFMMAVLVFIFGGFGVWALAWPASFMQDLFKVELSPLGRTEIRALGGMYLLVALIGAVAVFQQAWLYDAYRLFTFVLAALLISRVVSVISGDTMQTLWIIFGIEIVLIVHTIMRVRALG